MKKPNGSQTGQIFIEACVWIFVLMSALILTYQGFRSEYVRYRKSLYRSPVVDSLESQG